MLKRDFKDPPPKTLRELIYLDLKEAIIRGELKGNERIFDKEIAQLYNVSTTPVREALLRLEAEGFVQINAHREIIIREISHKELIELYQVISVLDGLAGSLAIKNLTERDIEEIESLHLKMEECAKKGYIEGYLEINTNIHMKIWKASSNQPLLNILHNIQNQLFRYNKARYVLYANKTVLNNSLKAHRELIKILKGKSRRRIENVLRAHWNVREFVLKGKQMLTESPERGKP